MVAERSPQRSMEYRMQRGAGRLGIPLEEYRRQVEAGLKWCTGCKVWQPRDQFGPSKSLLAGLMPECRESINARARENMRRLYWQRKAARA